MGWVFKKFWALIALTMLFLGIVFLPEDFLTRESAYHAWGKVFTVGNREILLAILCALCLARLWYIGTRLAFNDGEWPPIRKKLFYGLGAMFRADKRRAALRVMADDPNVQALTRSLYARFMLEKRDWTPIAQPGPLPIREHHENAGGTIVPTVPFAISLQQVIESPFHAIAGRMGKLVPKGSDFTVIVSRIRRQAQENIPLTDDLLDDPQGHWNRAQEEVRLANLEIVALKKHYESHVDDWQQVRLEADSLPQLLQGIAAETQL